MKDKNKFTITNKEGEELVCDVLFTYEDVKLNKNYIVYTDNSVDENGQTKVYANTYDPTGKDLSLGKIETDEEWENISNLLANLNEKLEVKDV